MEKQRAAEHRRDKWPYPTPILKFIILPVKTDWCRKEYLSFNCLVILV